MMASKMMASKMMTSKMIASKQLTNEAALKRRQSIKTLVFTNGAFDLLHAGHVGYLQQARSLGDALFLGLNSDQGVAALKGPKRPIVPQADRIRVLSALSCVDAVILFDDLTAHRLIEALKPEIYAKGGDYVLDPAQPGALLPEAPLVQSYGGRVELIPYQAGHSTTDLIRRIVETYGD